MFDLAQNLMTSAQRSHIEGYISVLGQRTKLQKSPFRIGLWPILSESEPEVAMGIGLVLAALLEQQPSISVYRLLAQVSEDPARYEWGLQKSQFAVDDWEIEGLDENAAIWGTFEIRENLLYFSVELENDAREDDITFNIDYQTHSLSELLNILPSIVENIVSWLDPSIAHSHDDQYEINSSDSSLVQEFLSQLFYWELDYFLELWGQPVDQSSALTDLNDLVSLSEQMTSNFGAWMIAKTMSRFMIFGDVSWSGLLIAHAKETVDSLSSYSIVAQVLGVTLFRLGYPLEAFDLLEGALNIHSKDIALWNILGTLYSEAREDLASIDVYQRAILSESATSETYLRYANLINLLSERQIELKAGNKHVSPSGRPFTDGYIFVDLNETYLNLREASIAYERAFELDNSNINALAQLVSSLVSLQDAKAWEYCQILVDKDQEGAIISSIIEQLSDENMEFLIGILKKNLENYPNQTNIRINLVRAYLAIGENDKARTQLENISRDALPVRSLSILSRLHLRADDDSFETRISEIKDILQARGKVTAHDAEFLESVIEKEPSFSEGYQLLAEVYLSWGESDDALEILLDGQSNAPFDVDSSALLAKVLWDADQSDLAFAYLEKWLKEDSHNPTLLSLKGRFLFDDGQDEAAKASLLRAEEIDPSNIELNATRLYIANVLIETRKD